ncbi:MAG: NAD(P)/FAD-dependent oxidoreductase [Lachnospiraceae bacterium]|nr:NAD(P)/FAD-dependent oxidoreductase [Lachnospiraceae bacterium]
MLRIQQLNLEIPRFQTEEEYDNYQKRQLEKKILKLLKISSKDLKSFSIIRRSLDARKKPTLFYSYIVDVEVSNEVQLLQKNKLKNVSAIDTAEYHFPELPFKGTSPKSSRPVIIGLGPAGLFCGYYLAKQGLNPIILERGKPVEQRLKDVEDFWNSGVLNTESNVQFGEGGAGTFSDGKLNTLVKDKYGRNKEVLKVFVENGAPEKIIYDQKPHIGTDVLIDVVRNIRNKMLSLGAEIHYETKMTDILQNGGIITGVKTNDGRMFPTNTVVLAIGHSARDTFRMCHERNIPMEPKSFAVGFRVEHPQELINIQQYGENYPDCLPTAAYKVTAKSDNGRGVYSFCMCPGGYVVNASSEEGHLAINGMSYSKRDGKNANSAIIISVNPEDFSGQGPLSGVEFQRQIEKKAYEIGNGKIPIQYYKDFKGSPEHNGTIPQGFTPSIKGNYQFADVNQILPTQLNSSFIQGMEHFHKIIPGFADDYALVSGIESRTSSPLRILRDESGQSTSLKGLYPCGEGAGYAGGITSAAMDGLYVAERIVMNHNSID